MKQISFIIIVILLTVILFSIFKYASDEPVFENMSQGRFMIVAAIVNDKSATTSDMEKISALKKLNVTDPKVKDILDSTDGNGVKIENIKKIIENITL
jgi:membrane protein involved in colicin uptake